MCRRKRQQKHLFANTMYKGFVRRGAVVIPDTIEEGPDLEEVKSELLARMRAIQAEDKRAGKPEELWYTVQGDQDGIWHGCMTKRVVTTRATTTAYRGGLGYL